MAERRRVNKTKAAAAATATAATPESWEWHGIVPEVIVKEGGHDCGDLSEDLTLEEDGCESEDLAPEFVDFSVLARYKDCPSPPLTENDANVDKVDLTTNLGTSKVRGTKRKSSAGGASTDKRVAQKESPTKKDQKPVVWPPKESTLYRMNNCGERAVRSYRKDLVIQRNEVLKSFATVCEKTGRYTCNMCGKVTANSTNANSHLTLKHAELLPFQCNICNEVFKSKTEFVDHFLTHKMFEQRHVCDLCGRRFEFLPDLLNHGKMAHPAFQVVCCECGQHFLLKRQLYKHLETHKNVSTQSRMQYNNCCEMPEMTCIDGSKRTGNFSCALCTSFNSTRKVAFIEHMMTHYNLRPYPCNVCANNRYISKFHLALHVVTTHCTRILPMEPSSSGSD